jgi:hypothetical protein
MAEKHSRGSIPSKQWPWLSVHSHKQPLPGTFTHTHTHAHMHRLMYNKYTHRHTHIPVGHVCAVPSPPLAHSAHCADGASMCVPPLLLALLRYYYCGGERGALAHQHRLLCGLQGLHMIKRFRTYALCLHNLGQLL